VVPAGAPTFGSIAALVAAFSARRLSPVEVVDDLLRRAELLEPVLRAYVTLDPEAARTAARDAEREIARDGPRGPLHGIPIAVKDNLAVPGWPTAAGSPLLRGHDPGVEAAVVTRLRAAGAIVVGKTALHEWAMGGTCTRQPGGPVRNPWDPARVPGGSSGGSAVAVAAGLAVAAIGTDGMGSIRTPAAYCGIVGLKPTRGLVSRFGTVPPARTGYDHVGPLARSVADARIVLRAIAGHDPRDPMSRPAGTPPASGGRAGALRIGLVGSPLLDDVRPAVRSAVQGAVDRLVDGGARIRRVALPRLADSPLLGPAMRTDAHELLLPLAAGHPAGFANPDIRLRILAAELQPARDAARARVLGEALAREVDAALEHVDVLVLPTNGTPAFPIDASTVEVGDGTVVDLRRPGGQARITTKLGIPFNVAGVPAITVPAPDLVEGLPVGVQLVGRRHGDEALLDVAERLEQAGARYRRPPLEDLVAAVAW
jgi:aspartyl-tRNA(Asn)/glutamyl-tRNA(Gln) amidotransferase subunit A